MDDIVYIGYDKDNFLFNSLKEKDTILDLNFIEPTKDECKKLSTKSWDVSCNNFFRDNSLNCIKENLCKNKSNVEFIENVDSEHQSYYKRSLELDEEFKNVFLDTLNLAIGITFVSIIIFKISGSLRNL
jgi:DNA-dependent RNA polymerase auxiliary subunit epsilon